MRLWFLCTIGGVGATVGFGRFVTATNVNVDAAGAGGVDIELGDEGVVWYSSMGWAVVAVVRPRVADSKAIANGVSFMPKKPLVVRDCNS